MNTGSMDINSDAQHVGDRLANDLYLAFLARGFYLPMYGGTPVDGRPCVRVKPIPSDRATRMLKILGPPSLRRASTDGDDPMDLAEDAVNALNRALFEAGLSLPSLECDEPSFLTGSVLVSLGCARPDVVSRIADVITKGARA